MIIRRRILLTAAGSVLTAPAIAQSYPSKNIQMVVPYPPGGGTDGLGRLTADVLSEKLGQQIIIRNIGGASSVTGSDTVRRADADGYTLLFNASLFVLGKNVVASCPYDPQTDFRPIAQAGEAPLVLLVNLNVPGTDYKTTMEAIGKEPKKYFFALSSGGSAGHVATLEFLRRTRLPLDTVLYKGTAPANADLLGGSVQLFMDPWTALLPLARSGKARAMFVTSKERTGLAPDIPTTNEVGLDGFNISSWYGVWAPKGTPDAVVDRLAVAMAEVSKDKGFIAKTGSLGVVPTARGPAEFAAFIKQEVETNTKLLQDAGYKPE
ncbi:MAG: tripartite tricarboxylate transporter substrate binding protein [Reyranella sp.]|uniref:Bug family tripartite tricarboxylate transporter substrate binding protein n=1 Tax=Reyranella sp. TaxID=1929291 RepID=UPI001ACD3940|nr:tripartite tricarboxylate transporter substrate binding protein [Reyranella sp.]MBN9087444.1 tripartite tricarboxylate transporter substrate binding protein [Reyranella sp.]